MVISWQPSAGVSSYTVERSLDGSTWSVIATGWTPTSYVDPGLGYSTTYYYRTLAVSSTGATAASAIVGATTAAQTDVLTAESLAVSMTRGVSFTGPIAMFEDAKLTTMAGSFAATISWGSGRFSVGNVSGSDGIFSIMGTHVFSQLGVHVIHVTVSLTEPDAASVVVTSTADVTVRRRQTNVRARRIARLERELGHAARKPAR
jgi:hypothetical protein